MELKWINNEILGEIDCTSLPRNRNLPIMWSLDCLVMKVLTQIDLYSYFQSLKMMYDYESYLVVRTPQACPWEFDGLLHAQMGADICTTVLGVLIGIPLLPLVVRSFFVLAFP